MLHHLARLIVFATATIPFLQRDGLAQAPNVPREIPSYIKPPELPEGLKFIPSERGEYRMYLNSHEKKKNAFLSLPENKLEAQKQADVPDRAFIPAVRAEASEHTTWLGVSPFDVVANEIELWLRLSAVPPLADRTEFQVRLSQDGSLLSERNLVVTKDEFAIDLGNNVQVLSRYPVPGLMVKKGAALRLEVTRLNHKANPDGSGSLEIWGVGYSHVEFRPTASNPSAHQTVFGIRPKDAIDNPGNAPRKPGSNTAPAPPEKPKPGAGSKVDREKTAASKLKLAKTLLGSNKDAALKRLQDIIKDFGGTDAAKEAESILAGQ